MKLNPALFFTYILVWMFLAIDPWYREDWLLENILVFVALPIIVWSDRRFGFSPLSAGMLFVFFILHAIGAHYTYSEMPWFEPLTRLFGFDRNHFDRLAHFLFGFLLFLPFYELFRSFFPSRRSVLWFTFVFMVASSGVYEILEWLATEVTHAELGTAFLGTQGDPWDAQKDMALGHLGSAAALFCFYRRGAKRTL